MEICRYTADRIADARFDHSLSLLCYMDGGVMGRIDSALTAANEEAQRFYRAMEGAKIRDEGVWIDL